MPVRQAFQRGGRMLTDVHHSTGRGAADVLLSTKQKACTWAWASLLACQLQVPAQVVFQTPRRPATHHQPALECAQQRPADSLMQALRPGGIVLVVVAPATPPAVPRSARLAGLS